MPVILSDRWMRIRRFNDYILLKKDIQPGDFWEGVINIRFCKLEKQVLKCRSYADYDALLIKYNFIKEVA